VDCDDISKIYSADSILHFAGVEYNDMKTSAGNVPMMGALKCQCQNDIGGKASKYYTIYNKLYPVTIDGQTEDKQICAAFLQDFLKEKVMNNGIKYVIIILNTVIRMTVIAIITKIGCSTESNQMIYITNMVFIC